MDTWDTWMAPLQKMMANKREPEMKGMPEIPDVDDEEVYCPLLGDLPDWHQMGAREFMKALMENLDSGIIY